MKKAYLIIAVTSILIGCSKNGPDTPRDPNAWMYDESLPVPVMMNSVTEAATKASVESLDGITIGVMGLDGREGLPDWKWSGGIEYPQHQGILLNNQEASIVSGAIQFADGPKYYPIAGSNAYNFYAYHPKQTISYIAKPYTVRAQNLSGAAAAILNPRHRRSPNSKSTAAAPKKPSSSQMMVKIKSFCGSETYPNFWRLLPRPSPNKPPEPMA